MGDQGDIRELRRRLEKLEDAYNKEKKQRRALIAFLRVMFVRLKKAYKEMTGEDINLPTQ